LNWYEPPRGEDAIAVIEGLHAIGLAIGDKVVVGGIKTGTLRYCGKTAFASGKFVLKCAQEGFILLNYIGAKYNQDFLIVNLYS